MARQIYGSTQLSDTYGMLRLKMMGCVVAIVQHAHALENVDSVLSRSDLYYITHVGGILYTVVHTTGSVRIFSTFLTSTM